MKLFNYFIIKPSEKSRIFKIDLYYTYIQNNLKNYKKYSVYSRLH